VSYAYVITLRAGESRHPVTLSYLNEKRVITEKKHPRTFPLCFFPIYGTGDGNRAASLSYRRRRRVCLALQPPLGQCLKLGGCKACTEKRSSIEVAARGLLTIIS
jgi:hypothetical protein